MRILLVIPNIVSFNSFLRELSSTLVDQGAEVHCVCNMDYLWDRGHETADIQVSMHNIPFARGMNLSNRVMNSFRLNRLVNSLKPGIVHAHFSSSIFTTALARRSNWPANIGTFQGVGFLLMDGIRSRLLRKAETWASRRLDAVWVLTEDDLQGLSEAAPRARIEKQQSLGFGCDLSRFDPASIHLEQRNQVREQLGLTSDHIVFAFIGRRVQFKGFDLTVHAFLDFAEKDPNVRLLLLGTRDPLHPTGLTEKEEELASKSPQIIDLGWQAQVQKYLSITHVVVFPSQREGVPVCLMEALAMGVPVITRDTRGCRDVVRHQIDGLVLKDCTADKLSKAMRKMAYDKELRDSLSQNALRDRERFDRYNYVREQIEIYENILSSF